MNESVVTVDVRPDIREGRPPFDRLMAAVEALTPGQVLRVLAPIEPGPLKQLLARRGFTHQTRTLPAGDWEVVFQQGATEPAPPPPAAPAPATDGSKCVLSLDARGLEPPQPMVRILEAAASLPPGGTLAARTERRPMHLYAALAERGFTGDSEAQDDGSFITYVRRA